MSLKAVHFVGTSREDLRAFPDEAREDAGFQLWRLEQGPDPDHWKPMPQVGPGVREIIISAEEEHRVFYVTNIGDRVYVLHAFEKKTQRTRRADINLGKQRLRRLKQQLQGATRRKGR